jgi:hypothetical protein
MQKFVASLLSVELLVASGGASLADGPKRRAHVHSHARYVLNLPSAIAERQRHASTFDSSQYFEHDSNKIPFGTREWWDQKAREGF